MTLQANVYNKWCVLLPRSFPSFPGVKVPYSTPCQELSPAYPKCCLGTVLGHYPEGVVTVLGHYPFYLGIVPGTVPRQQVCPRTVPGLVLGTVLGHYPTSPRANKDNVRNTFGFGTDVPIDYEATPNCDAGCVHLQPKVCHKVCHVILHGILQAWYTSSPKYAMEYAMKYDVSYSMAYFLPIVPRSRP